MKTNTREELLYKLSKLIAENDSLGEGWLYHPDYTRQDFVGEIENGHAVNYRAMAEEGLIFIDEYVEQERIKAVIDVLENLRFVTYSADDEVRTKHLNSILQRLLKPKLDQLKSQLK